MNVDPYNPNPKMKDKIVPTAKLLSFSTRKFTIGCLKTNSRQTNK